MVEEEVWMKVRASEFADGSSPVRLWIQSKLGTDAVMISAE